MRRKLLWFFFIFFAIVIGLYPVSYILFDMSKGLFSSKGPEVLENFFWRTAFYQHIFFGGVALLTGWPQFLKRFRDKNLHWHRRLGAVYLIAVLLSGTAGLYIALYASGGMVSVTGFSGLAIGWLLTAAMAYSAIRKLDIDDHQFWMIRCYAFCFAAVTLRIWLPLFQFGFHIEFLPAYRIIAWLCWVPNLIVAELIIRNIRATRLGSIVDVGS
jgi:hypothetical protein